ncbi:MAG: hypothetical protein LH606_11635, partial [Cytophagaceae bacterium]|nr:hypothetical protein [Cytophagaceae bacterium]
RKPAKGPIRNVVTVFDSSLHYFRSGGVESRQVRLKRVVLPEDAHSYARILMHVSLACTEKGCDPWDQVGQIFVHKNGEIIELGRFITPYGVACKPWIIDVTDFKSVLQGNCLIQSYIRAYSAVGWKLSVSFEFLENGPNPYPYQKLTSLWQHDYLLYGDERSAAQLPDTRLQLNPRTRAVAVRHTITGHGQDNADNAAEFARKTHFLILKKAGKPDSTVIKHLLWRSDCDKNPCTFQKGAYAISRAGWCPGQEVRPFSVNLPVSKESFTLGYHFQPYRNQRPYTSKDYVSMPNFLIHSYLVEKSDSLLASAMYRNVACERVEVRGETIQVQIRNTGTETIDKLNLHCSLNGKTFARQFFVESLKPNEAKTFTFKKRLPVSPDKTTALSVLADLEGDENVNDDVVSGISYQYKSSVGAARRAVEKPDHLSDRGSIFRGVVGSGVVRRLKKI